jgi:hypothetical protein
VAFPAVVLSIFALVSLLHSWVFFIEYPKNSNRPEKKEIWIDILREMGSENVRMLGWISVAIAIFFIQSVVFLVYFGGQSSVPNKIVLVGLGAALMIRGVFVALRRAIRSDFSDKFFIFGASLAEISAGALLLVCAQFF